MNKNLFIALEGIDGSGKSTQAKILTQKLEREGIKVHATCEPTNGPIGKMIRDIFTRKLEADHRTIAPLFIADRLEHLLNPLNGIIRMLADGYTVITDRYYFSSYAYQSPHVGMDWVVRANSICASLRRPDVNIYIDISPEISVERISRGRDKIELYESLDELVKVKDAYFRVMEQLKNEETIRIIDGNRTPEPISEDIWNLVSGLF